MDFFNHVTILVGLAVMAVQQILTFRAVPVSFANRYPVPTLIVLSTVASILAVVFNKEAVPQSVGDWVLLVASVGVTAAVVYNHTLRNWAQLRAMEGEK
jgi:hypothetical protein